MSGFRDWVQAGVLKTKGKYMTMSGKAVLAVKRQLQCIKCNLPYRFCFPQAS